MEAQPDQRADQRANAEHTDTDHTLWTDDSCAGGSEWGETEGNDVEVIVLNEPLQERGMLRRGVGPLHQQRPQDPNDLVNASIDDGVERGLPERPVGGNGRVPESRGIGHVIALQASTNQCPMRMDAKQSTSHAACVGWPQAKEDV